MSGDPNLLPWQFRKLRSRLVVRDANGDGPLLIIEGGYNAEAVAMIERAMRAGAYDPITPPAQRCRPATEF